MVLLTLIVNGFVRGAGWGCGRAVSIFWGSEIRTGLAVGGMTKLLSPKKKLSVASKSNRPKLYALGTGECQDALSDGGPFGRSD